MPLQNPGQVFRKWGKDLNSDIVSASALGQTFVVLNSASMAVDLLDGRSGIYSSRATSTMANELLGWDYLFVLLPYNERWRRRRRMFVQHFRPGDMSIIHPQAKEYTGRLLVELHRTPDQFHDVIRGTIGGFVVSLAYGIPVKARGDPYLDFAERSIQLVADAASPGAYFVDILPILKHVPSWFPGAGFKRLAKRLRYMPEDFRTTPFDDALRHLSAGDAKPSFVSVALESVDENSPHAERDKEVIKDAAAMFYFAGTDTVAGSLIVWVWLMMKYPDVQARMHDEIDRVLGAERMPQYDDEDQLPYLKATLMESVRWKTIAPLTVPHTTTEDDVYAGYFIPKNSIVMANVWAMFRNEQDFGEDTDRFNPDRFIKDGRINPDVRDPFTLVFGFGRRACPGAHIGRTVLWITAASLAATYRWSEPLKKDEITLAKETSEEPEPFENGFMVIPKHFPCEWKVRSAAARVNLANLESTMEA